MDPWGKIIAEIPEEVDVCLAEIDLDYLRKRRSEMPVTSHRRHDLYGHINTNTVCEFIFQCFGRIEEKISVNIHHCYCTKSKY